jgi:hypothetical protein
MGTMLLIKNLLFIIHTRDHGHPHVTVYFGTPKSWECRAKVRLDVVSELEVDGFSKRDMKFILEMTERNQKEWLEEWNEIVKSQKK